MNDSGRRPSRILITNHGLEQHRGTELFVRDLALHLQRRGYAPIVYAPALGDVARHLERQAIPVTADLASIAPAPELIHAQHHVPAMTACLRFPAVPAVFACHGWTPWEERPPVFPSIKHYVAVDDLCRERVVRTAGIAEQQVTTIYNGVDLERFRRRSPLPAQPRRALVFSNYASESTHAPLVRAACERMGIGCVDVVGYGSGNPTVEPERLLGQYDLVFAKARCAIEALAVGAAVIVLDTAGCAGLVTPANVADWRRWNFGFQLLSQRPLGIEAIVDEIRQYDSGRSAAVTDWIRREAEDRHSFAQYEAVYERALADAVQWDVPIAGQAWAAASTYLGDLGRDATAQMRQAADMAAAMREQHERESRRLSEALAESERNRGDLRRKLEDIESSRSWQTLAPYRRLRERWRWRAGKA